MFEIISGLLLLVIAAALKLGLGEGLLPMRGLHDAAALGAAVLGSLALLAGAYRQLRQRKTDAYWLRTSALMLTTAFLCGLAALLLPVSLAQIGAPQVAGFPVGFYVAAQGGLVLLVIIAFHFARKQDAIDNDHSG